MVSEPALDLEDVAPFSEESGGRLYRIQWSPRRNAAYWRGGKRGACRAPGQKGVAGSAGTYGLDFSVSATEPGQLAIALDSGGGMVELPLTVYGRATGTNYFFVANLLRTVLQGYVLALRDRVEVGAR